MVNPAAIAQQRKGASPSSKPVPAPVGGLNTRDAPSAMPATDALIMDNWFPGVKGVELRKGYDEHVTGLGGAVETLAEYHSGTTRKFLAASGSVIFDITTAGAATTLSTGYNSARWQVKTFNGYSLWFNGADTPQKYDGTSFSDNTFTGSGLTPSKLVSANIYRNRLFLREKDSADFWYGGTNSISGTLTKFQLSRVGKVGGNLAAIKTISRDGGNGPDDYIAFFMTSGEVFVYTGSDPGDANNWSIVGRFNIGEPIDENALLEYNGDVLVVTKADIRYLSKIIANGGVATQSSKLSGAISAAAREYSDNHGWQAVFYPRGNRVLINVPVSTNVKYWQYGFNTITNAAFRFKGMNASCWGVYNNDLYFGGIGAVYKADQGADDNGSAIDSSVQQAFSMLGNGRQKHFLQFHPIMTVLGSVDFTVGAAIDYGGIRISQDISTTSVGTPWGSDWGSAWSPEDWASQDVFGLGGMGRAISLKFDASTNGQEVTWYQTDFHYRNLTRF